MKKAFVIALAATAAVAALVAPATAKKSKATTLYLHGSHQVQEAALNEMWLDGIYMTMDATEPAAGAPKSMFVTNYMRGPNTDCDGNGLLPVWKGDIVGKHKGDITVSLNTVATPAVQLVASIYADATGTCSSAGTPATAASEAPAPVAQETVDVAAGPAVTEITFKNVKFKSLANVILQLHVPNLSTPGQVRILYDSADYASSVTFSGLK